jgi:hypothetical protein
MGKAPYRLDEYLRALDANWNRGRKSDDQRDSAPFSRLGNGDMGDDGR